MSCGPQVAPLHGMRPRCIGERTPQYSCQFVCVIIPISLSGCLHIYVDTAVNLRYYHRKNTISISSQHVIHVNISIKLFYGIDGVVPTLILMLNNRYYTATPTPRLHSILPWPEGSGLPWPGLALADTHSSLLLQRASGLSDHPT